MKSLSWVAMGIMLSSYLECTRVGGHACHFEKLASANTLHPPSRSCFPSPEHIPNECQTSRSNRARFPDTHWTNSERKEFRILWGMCSKFGMFLEFAKCTRITIGGSVCGTSSANARNVFWFGSCFEMLHLYVESGGHACRDCKPV